MKNQLKIGLWLPPRKNLNASITMENPAHIDARLYDLFLEYLNEKECDYVEDLDFRKAFIKNNQVFIGEFCLSDLDHFVWMGMIDRSLDSYHLEILRVLSLSVKVHNSYEFFNLATDKFSTFSLLHQHGIPLPELYLVSSDNFEVLKPLFADASFLLKPRRSSFGIGIVKMDNYELFRDVAEYHRQKNFYLERFYKNDLNEWTGITVFNGKVLYGFRKKSSKIDGWKVYDKDSLGGQTIYVKPNAEIEAISLKIGELLGANYYGLDFIKTEEGYKVVDINCSPGIYYDFMMDLDIPVAELFFKMLPM